jgi:hypothetical protein
MPITCFMIIPTGVASLKLRRYSVETACPNGGCHDAVTYIGTAPIKWTDRGFYDTINTSRSDPRWPIRCTCGYVFKETDQWQTVQDEIYEAPDGQKYTTNFRDAPPGAMWDALHLKDIWPGPDGMSLCVVLPSGEHWCIDSPSRTGGFWDRKDKGIPPRISPTPSIQSSRYHGFLVDGTFTDDIEGRTYEME